MTELDKNQLHFIPLGGSEEFGINLNVYGFQNKYLVVDCGLGFAGERFPGVDIVLPDPAWLEERQKDLVGLVITHAHEDHIGAVAHLWRRLKCPIYCSKFTASILQHKFQEHGIKDAPIHIAKPMQTIKRKPFDVQFIPVSHSVPETMSLAITTSVGTVVHSGDWNLDPDPVLGAKTEPEIFQELGRKGVLAYIGDSTNANIDGMSGSEREVEKGLAALFKEQKGRIVITMFASNVGRIQSIVKAAQACDRSVSVVGRSLHRMISTAKECGYLQDLPEFTSLDDLSYIPHEKSVIIATGSQGESRAAMARISRGDHDVKLSLGDTAIFSARAIPGNEADINLIKNRLVASGVKVISPNDTKHKIHVSGHPRREEIMQMLQWLQPDIVIPVHGERVMLDAHAELARGLQVKHIHVPVNGAVFRLGPDMPELIDHIENGILAVEPERLMASDHQALRERRKLQYAGVVQASVVLDSRGDLVADPKITTIGLIDPEDEEEVEFEENIIDEIIEILKDIPYEDRLDNHVVGEELRIGVRRYVHHFLGIKPIATIHVLRA